MDITKVAPPAYNGLKSQTGSASAQIGSSASPTVSDSSRQLSSDFETFLRMLTVQMQNQDPLNPVDSSDYAVQLATFSSVEQQVLTNDLLRALGDQMGGGTLGQLADWVGMEALARAPVAFDGGPVHLRPNFAAEADSAVLVVRNSSGTVVGRQPLQTGEDAVTWLGLDDTGAPFPADIYRFEIESYSNGALINTQQSQAYSGIEEARIEGKTILLRLSDGSEVESSRVAGIRAPG
ncbi:flagellar hook capping FlgD N-terminal domain-containing protein [Puniceibacterium confluentis]|uniref:flagellar hook capping FlgD N-terminal domain-containing protein n=1 Tax=Puniceibacterium confluentis TaxID=1958944 RepID=UPI00356469C7